MPTTNNISWQCDCGFGHKLTVWQRAEETTQRGCECGAVFRCTITPSPSWEERYHTAVAERDAATEEAVANRRKMTEFSDTIDLVRERTLELQRTSHTLHPYHQTTVRELLDLVGDK